MRLGPPALSDYASSIFLHTAALVLIAMGYSLHRVPLTLDPDPVTIEIVKVDKRTVTPIQKTTANPEKGKSKVFNSPKQMKSQKAPAPEKPKVNKNQAAKSDVAKIAEAIPLKKKPDIVQKKMPTPDAAAKTELKQKPISAPTPELKAKPKTIIDTTKPVVENKKDAFEDVLKAVSDMREKALDLEKDKEAKKKPPQENQDESAQTMTISEIDAFRRQLMSCWTPPAGIKDAESIVVEMDLTVHPDARLENAEIVDQRRFMADPTFRVAAEAALRALNHPACTPLLLPKQKHEVWKSFRLIFNPKDMF